jgi:competence protein ComEA
VPSPNREARSVLLLLVLAVLGHAARLIWSRPDAAPGEFLTAEHSPLDPLRHKARAERLARPLGPDEQIDLNSASAEEIARLPRVGMSLAKRIVAHRQSRGPFRGPADLDQVAGVGPALLAAIGNRVRYAGRPGWSPEGALGTGHANSRTAGSYGNAPNPVSGSRIDLNSAGEADLVSLPGIGTARARAILAYRRDNGPFAVVSDLERVPGISQSLARRLAPLVEVR